MSPKQLALCSNVSKSGNLLCLSLVGFNDTFNTYRLYNRPCQGCIQTAVLSGNHKTKPAVLFRLLTQTKEATKKRSRTVKSDKHIKRKVEKDDSE